MDNDEKAPKNDVSKEFAEYEQIVSELPSNKQRMISILEPRLPASSRPIIRHAKLVPLTDEFNPLDYGYVLISTEKLLERFEPHEFVCDLRCSFLKNLQSTLRSHGQSMVICVNCWTRFTPHRESNREEQNPTVSKTLCQDCMRFQIPALLAKIEKDECLKSVKRCLQSKEEIDSRIRKRAKSAISEDGESSQ